MPKKNYKCTNCGFTNPKWLGKCPNCQSWDSFVEVVIKDDKKEGKASGQTPVSSRSYNFSTQVQTLGEYTKNLDSRPDSRRLDFNNFLLQDFFSGGLVRGSLTLLAGEPGLGKSTLSLQLLRSLFGQSKPRLLYITAEESILELAHRSQRLGIPKEIMALQTANYEHIESILEKQKPDVVIIDSIQTIFSAEISNTPGSVSQVSYLASGFMALSKSLGISIILIGHVTKDGSIAGPKTLEHLVDMVVTLEPSEYSQFRTLSFNKNRYGSTDKQLLLKMKEEGLEVVTDASMALLENFEKGPGVVYGMAMNKNLPFVVEIQALVSKDNSNNNFGRREATCLKLSKLNTILAVIEKYLSIDFKFRDVYVQISGLPGNLLDHSLDLPIMLSILSSSSNKSVEEILKLKENKKISLFSGRLTLSGKLRKPTNADARSTTAEKLKFKLNPNINFGDLRDFWGS